MYGISNSALSKRLANFALQVYSSAHLGTWCFSLTTKHLFSSTFPYEQELHTFLEIEGTLDKAISQKDHVGPILLSDTLGFLWVSQIAAFHEDNSDPMLFLLGPIYLTNVDHNFVLEQFSTREISLSLRSRFLRILDEIPVLSYPMVEQYAKMLHSAILGDVVISIPQLYDISSTITQNTIQPGGNTDYQRSYQLEQELLSAIREGKENYLLQSSSNLANGIQFDLKLSNPLRQAKDTVIIFISLCARAAIEGGLSLVIGKEMELDYIYRAENAKTIMSLAKLNEEMFHDFCKKVAFNHKNPNISEPIQRCCNYIRTHYTEPLTINDIATHLGYTDYYISRKFAKEMGFHIADYINELRLNHAKHILTTTNMSIEDISSQLQYSSRTYFSRVFKKHFGLSPAQFRNQKKNI